MMPRSTLLLAIAASAGLASAATALLVNPAPAGNEARGLDAELAPLVSELRTLREALRRQPDALAPVLTRPAADPGPDSRVPLEAIDLRLERLTTAVEALVGRMTAGRMQGAPAGPTAAIDPAVRDAPVRWDEVHAFARQHVADPDVARRSVLFLTPREVVQRFGMPTESGARDGSMWMVYRQTDESGAVKVNVYLSFADGIVMFHKTEVH